jgi:hypothetical protein
MSTARWTARMAFGVSRDLLRLAVQVAEAFFAIAGLMFWTCAVYAPDQTVARLWAWSWPSAVAICVPIAVFRVVFSVVGRRMA